MFGRVGLVERAFEIAKTGRVWKIDDLVVALEREGHSHVRGALSGRSLSRQLLELAAQSRASQTGITLGDVVSLRTPVRRKTWRERQAQ